MIIPWQQLPVATLDNLLQEYASRDGTDYGWVETPLATKVAQLKSQLQSGKVVIVYSELHETVSVMLADQFVAN
ncbi:MAG: YheU family protein [Gammaproteobacteria bacterium]|nr:YheU family protein [Gammaproteobacteria bacterium]MCP4880449.1 YheU family protein [Gammaproteobacteria bacterium]MDP6165978.1 YheU family protein [Gammaproteobacteria bacterium]